MKSKLTSSLLGLSCLALSTNVVAQRVKGPSSSKLPYQSIYKDAPTGTKLVSIMTVGDSVGGYKLAGIPDGLGAFDNGDGTFTIVLNHEHGAGVGSTRAHGSNGAFVSKWIVSKDVNDMKVISGGDLIQRLHLWDRVNTTYVTYYTTTPFTTGLSRFCSADMAAPTAFYNSKTGKGTKARILMNGEESGADGRPMAHIVTGPEAGNSYDLPYLGKSSWENYVACPHESDTTIAIGTDDGTDGQVYVYVGVKKTTGNEVEKAGLTGGKLYGIKINGMIGESGPTVIKDSVFTLADLGNIRDSSGDHINTKSNNLGVMKFLRPEDGAWDPTHPNDFYFLTTNAVGQPSRMYRVRFNDLGNPAAGGKISAVLDGTEGQIMMDNMTIDNWGHALIQEDQGSDTTLAATWQYNLSTGAFTKILVHDTAMFYPKPTAHASFMTTNEEASGLLDVQHILGAGWFIGSDQIHVKRPGELVEDGQLFAFFNPDTYNSNPEISVKGNNNDVINGSTNPSATNNTDFGNVNRGFTTAKTFDIINEGVAALNVTGISFTGTDAADFSVTGATFPMTVAAGDTETVTVTFAPPATALGLRKADMNIMSNDFDEKGFKSAVQGVVYVNTGIASLPDGSAMKLFPNPTKDEVTVAVTLKNADKIAVTILDINGREMIGTMARDYEAGEQKIRLSTSMLPNGNYFVQVACGNAVTRTKLVVMH